MEIPHFSRNFTNALLPLIRFYFPSAPSRHSQLPCELIHPALFYPYIHIHISCLPTAMRLPPVFWSTGFFPSCIHVVVRNKRSVFWWLVWSVPSLQTKPWFLRMGLICFRLHGTSKSNQHTLCPSIPIIRRWLFLNSSKPSLWRKRTSENLKTNRQHSLFRRNRCRFVVNRVGLGKHFKEITLEKSTIHLFIAIHYRFTCGRSDVRKLDEGFLLKVSQISELLFCRELCIFEYFSFLTGGKM